VYSATPGYVQAGRYQGMHGMPKQWTAEDVGRLTRGFQQAAVVLAAAELDLFAVLASGAKTAAEVAAGLDADLRGTAVLLDALAAMGLLDKEGGSYAVPPAVADVLTEAGSHSMLRMTQHLANCYRRWGDIAEAVKTGRPSARRPSIRGDEGDRESFIGGMHDLAVATAPGLVAEMMPLGFRHLLDVGGGPATWAIEFLKAVPDATATVFDLPPVVPLGKARVEEAGLGDRVTFVEGDYNADPLPCGADFAWVSAIIHQNSREENRALLAKVFDALVPGGQVAIRDVVMEPSRTAPLAGALFAVNMLVATRGGTFTFGEIRDDLEAAGFADVMLARRDEAMNSIVTARKPKGGGT